ncbi:hypothetical protein D5086_014941 [Populus alba]|uniref:Uncharacterized protein n=1 Tax=Populus alba TaxID=43335 RepID=A0ACC4BZ42_POPAL
MMELAKTGEINKPIGDEEANEFLKLMRYSEYSVDITQDSIQHLVGGIQATNYIYFTDDELDHEATGHNKPLHITIKCKDYMIAKVLIDNGSTLNVLPRHVLDKMPVDVSHMKPSTMTARAYNGSPKPIIRSIDVELIIGPKPFQLTLQVKFIIHGNLVTVRVEKTLSMMRNMSIPYIETEESKDGNLHVFEVLNVEWVPKNTIRRKLEISEAAKMAAKYFLKHGFPFKYDLSTRMSERINVIKMKCVDHRFGIGFKPGKANFKREAEIRREETSPD